MPYESNKNETTVRDAALKLLLRFPSPFSYSFPLYNLLINYWNYA